MALLQSGFSSSDLRWNLEMVVFVEGEKSENPEENPWSKDENQQQTQPTCDTGPGIEPGRQWWEASALITAPSLLPKSLLMNSTIHKTGHAL